MKYTPTEWNTGDVITAEKLNNIEQGISECNGYYSRSIWKTGDLITADKLNKLEEGICGGNADYIKTVWATGDIITAEKLNNIENGVKNGNEIALWDDMTWGNIIAATKNGKYKNFEIGAMKELNIGTEGIVHMQIAGIDADELADGSGKAPLTVISKELLKTRHEMSADGDTGAVGGWERCAMRAYLSSTVFPLIPPEVGTNIKVVIKSSRILNDAREEVNNVLTNDTLWIPSVCEIYGPEAGAETIGCYYNGVFSVVDERLKSVVGEDSPTLWWLRSASLQTNIYSRYNNVHSDGEYYRNRCTNAYGVALGFCL